MPVETKVQASTAAAAVSGLALFALGRYVFKGAVPDVVASWVYVIVPGIITFAAGYLAKHTNRPAPAPAITVDTAGAAPAEIGRQVAAAIKAGGLLTGGTLREPEKTLAPPAAPGPEGA